MSPQPVRFISSAEVVIPDKIDPVSTFLPSFADLRRKNLEALYGDGRDNSPKGSVDVAIRELCGWVNSHPSFVTLSSCSGRIAVFDLKDSHQGNGERGDDDDDADDERGGKGRGEWILVSHEPIDRNTLPPLLSKDLTGKLIFKHEPLLLHVAAASLDRGRQLLSLALQLGFRESGIVVTPLRVTVAIRSHSLALTVPLAYSGPLRPTDEYLVALVEEANQKMKSNMEKLNRLETEIKRVLFRDRQTEASSNDNQQVHINVRLTKLPALNLWGHDAVVVPSSKDGVSANVYVFGGYGSGPYVQGLHPATTQKIGRSNRMYCLQQCVDGHMESEWRPVEQIALLPKEATTWFGVDVRPKPFFPCEGLQACLLPLEPLRKDGDLKSAVIAIWGGRSGPSTPYGELLLYEPETNPGYFSEPIEVRGDHPSPRWGHTLTALSGKDGVMAILIGGRDKEACSPGNVHVLGLVDDGDKRVFTWKRIVTNIPPQFHHSAAVLDDDVVIIFRGLLDPNNLVECLTESNTILSEMRNPAVTQSFVGVFHVTLDAVIDMRIPHVDGFIPHFGASSCSLTREGGIIIPFIGGTPHGGNSGDIVDSIRWYTFDGDELSNCELQYDPLHTEDVNFGAMIHGCCVSLPTSSELLILGGGVSSFAFGAAFADCFRVCLEDVSASCNTSILEALRNVRTATHAEEADGEDSEMERMTRVFHVPNKDAKALRTALDSEFLLDKTFRMGKADIIHSAGKGGTTCIAVPVKEEAFTSLTGPIPPTWAHLIVSSGLQKMRLSSSTIGSQKQLMRR